METNIRGLLLRILVSKGGKTLCGMSRAFKTQFVVSKHTNAFASASYSPVHRNQGGDFIIQHAIEGTRLSQRQIQVMCKPSQGDTTVIMEKEVNNRLITGG